MEAMIHFLFELIKISVLSCMYASLVLLFCIYIGHNKTRGWFARALRIKIRIWLNSGLSISVALFIYMFSYYGNHGLGDSKRIPLGHGRAVEQSNGSGGYIQDEGPITTMRGIFLFII